MVTPFHPVTGLPEEGIAWLPETDVMTAEQRRLEALVARTVPRRSARRVQCKVVIGDPFRRITHAARDVDSIVMATAGRTGLAHLVIGSVAEKVVRHAPVPVLTLRAEGAGAKARTRRRGGGRRRAPGSARRR